MVRLRRAVAIQPSGTLDAVHAENGDAIKCEIYFAKPNMQFGGPTFQPDCNYQWQTPDEYGVLGGDYIGGTWRVRLLINGAEAAIVGGPIVAPG
jgi:hypothetical protein